MKLTAILLASSLSLSGCAYSFTEPVTEIPSEIIYQKIEKKTLRNDIGYDNVVLKNFEDLDENIPSKKIELPEDLENLIFDKEIKIKDNAAFEKQVYKEANKLGYNPEKIRDLTPKQTIQLIANIVKQKLSYSMKHNEDPSKTVDDLFSEGTAECTMYTKITTAIFNTFKKINLKLTNFYMIDAVFNRIGRIPHDWNTILVYDNKKLQVSYIDVTYYEYKSAINAVDDEHVDVAWKEILIYKLRDYKNAVEEFQKLFELTTERETQADLLMQIRDCAIILIDKELEEKSKKKLLEEYQDTLMGRIIKTQELTKK